MIVAYIIGASVAFFCAIMYLANVADRHARRIGMLEKQLAGKQDASCLRAHVDMCDAIAKVHGCP